jgi:hypothetical protein
MDKEEKILFVLVIILVLYGFLVMFKYPHPITIGLLCLYVHYLTRKSVIYEVTKWKKNQ